MARFTSDMGRAAQVTEQAMGKMGAAVNGVKGALAALGIGVSAGAFVALVKGAIDAADNLRDMSQKTGIAVETLNGLAFAAGQAGGNLESMVAAAGKLNKSIVEAAGGNRDVGEAFSKLGISVRDASGQLKSADVVMAEVADKFKGYADGPQKVAIALRIFGKAGADMIPVLNDGGDSMRENIEYAKKYSGVTQELAEASDNFNDSLGKLAIQQKGFGNAMATALLPLLQAVTNEYLAATEQSNKYALAANVVRTTLETFVIVGSEVAFTFKAVGTEVGGILSQLDRLTHGDMKGFTAISDAMTADAEKARKDHDEFIAGILDRTPKPVATDGAPADPKKPAAPTLRAKGDDPTKALLDGKLKALDDAYAKERDIASFHEKFMQALREQDIVDIDTYQAFKTASIEQGLASAIRTYDAEIAVLEKARAATAKTAERAEIDNKIRDKNALKDKARMDAQQAASMQVLELSAAQSDLNKAMKEWGIQQDHSNAQMEFSNSLYGKSALEVQQLTEARRIELDVDEKIRLAKEKGAISDATIARFRADAKAKSDAAGKFIKTGAVQQAVDGLRKPEEIEQQNHDNLMKTLLAGKDDELKVIAGGNLAIERENARHQEAMVSIRMQANLQTIQIAGDSAGQLYNVLKQAGLEQTALGKALFIANKAIAIAEIIVNTELAAAKALAMGPIIGPPLAMGIRVMGYASAGIVLGTAIASAEGGYDIPAGTNPVTQLHEKEMVLPKAQADVIRGLAANGGKGSGGSPITYSPTINIDSRSDQAQVRQLVSGAIEQGNADLVDKLQRAGRI